MSFHLKPPIGPVPSTVFEVPSDLVLWHLMTGCHLFVGLTLHKWQWSCPNVTLVVELNLKPIFVSTG